MSAVLAATNWPEKAQERQPHGTHAHSRATRKFLDPVRNHPAVQGMQSLLDQGAPLEAMFTFVMQLSWPDLKIATLPRWTPPGWNEQLRDFYAKSNLATWWKDEDHAWQSSINESRKMFKSVAFKPFLKPFLGDIAENFIFVPNISHPTNQEVSIRLPGELLCITAPRLAWGDSPPWPFDEDPAHVYRAVISQFGKLLMHAYLRANADKLTEVTQTALPVSDQFRAKYPTWQEQFTNLFTAAATAMYLEANVNKAEMSAYVLMERKVNGMGFLPGTISVWRRYLSEREAGRYSSLMDFLPVFPKQLRVANRIVTL
jgi:hypothetical protein